MSSDELKRALHTCVQLSKEATTQTTCCAPPAKHTRVLASLGVLSIVLHHSSPVKRSRLRTLHHRKGSNRLI